MPKPRKPSWNRPKPGKPDGVLGGRRRGREARFTNFDFLVEQGRVTPPNSHSSSETNPALKPTMQQPFDRAFMTRKRLRAKSGAELPTWIGTIRVDGQKRPRVYYVDRRGGEDRRKGKEKSVLWREPAKGIMGTLLEPKQAKIVAGVLAEGVRPAELLKPLRVFQTKKPVKGARLLATFAASDQPEQRRMVYFERRERRRGTHVFRGFTLDALVEYLLPKAKAGRRVRITMAPELFPTSSLPSVFVTASPVKDAKFVARIQVNGRSYWYIYEAGRGPDQAPKAPREPY